MDPGALLRAAIKSKGPEVLFRIREAEPPACVGCTWLKRASVRRDEPFSGVLTPQLRVPHEGSQSLFITPERDGNRIWRNELIRQDRRGMKRQRSTLAGTKRHGLAAGARAARSAAAALAYPSDPAIGSRNPLEPALSSDPDSGTWNQKLKRTPIMGAQSVLFRNPEARPSVTLE